MKKIILGAVICITILATLSMTIDQARFSDRISGSTGVHLNVPAKPAATAYVMGTEKMYQYIKKGFQVQQVVDDPTHASTYHHFLMVKY